MALTTPRIIGRQLTVTADGAKTIWDTIELTEEFNDDGATASDSTLDEVVGTTKILRGTVTGFLGAVNNGGTLPAIGDAISDFAVAVGADSVIPVISSYTNIKVRTTTYNFASGPGRFTFTFRSGVLI